SVRHERDGRFGIRLPAHGGRSTSRLVSGLIEITFSTSKSKRSKYPTVSGDADPRVPERHYKSHANHSYIRVYPAPLSRIQESRGARDGIRSRDWQGHCAPIGTGGHESRHSRTRCG